jgi:hypothetical protein
MAIAWKFTMLQTAKFHDGFLLALSANRCIPAEQEQNDSRYNRQLISRGHAFSFGLTEN